MYSSPRSVENQFRALVESADGYAVFTLDREGNVASWNPSAELLVGYRDEEVVGDQLPSLFPSDAERDAILADLDRDAAEEPLEREVWLHRKDGTRFRARVALRAERDDDGSSLGCVVLVRDVTRRSDEARELERYRALVDAASDGIYQLDSDGRFVVVNDVIAAITGYDRDELIGAPASVLIDAADVDRVRGTIRELLAAGETASGPIELDVRTASGETIPCELRLRLLLSDEGFEGSVGVVRDVSHRRRREREIRRERELTDRLLETVPVPLTVHDADGAIVRANRRVQELFGLTEAEFVERPPIEYWRVFDRDGEPLSPNEFPVERVRATGEPVFGQEIAFESPDGDRLWFLVDAAGVRDADGNLERIVVAGEEITRHKRYQRELERRRERELERYETTVNAVSDGIYALDDASRFVLVNDAYASMTGYDREELIGKAAADVTGAEVGVEAERIRERLGTDREVVTFEADLPTVEGTTVPIEARLASFSLGGDRYGRVGVVRDVTERRWFEGTLAALNGATRDLLQTDSADDVCERAVDTAVALLDLPGAAVLLLDDDGSLRPGACSTYVVDLLGEEPVIGPDDPAISWEALRRGRTVTVDDVRESTRAYRRDTPVRSGIWHPLGDRGVFVVVSEEREAFDRRRRRLVELLAATIETALDRVDRDARRRRREEQLEALSETSGALLDAQRPQNVCDLAVETSRTALGLPIAAIALYDESSGALRTRARSPGADAALDDALLFDPEADLAWRAYVEDRLCVFSELPTSDPSDRPASGVAILPLGRHGVFVVGSDDAPSDDATLADLLAAHTEPAFAKILAANAEAALDRTTREQQLVEREALLQRQNRSLERLNRVNTVIRQIHESLVDAASRREIERAVCTRLSTAGPYVFAWIGEFDPVSDAVTPTHWAGAEGGYLDRIRPTADDDPRGDPVAAAIDSRRPQVVDDVLADPPFEPWRREALRRGYRSMIALPILYRDTLYGVLAVYADRPGGFDDLEREVLHELSETIAHSIDALESKRALIRDSVVEIEFRIRDPAVSFLGLTSELDADFDLVSLVPAADGRVRAFFTVVGASSADVVSFARGTLDVRDVALVSERGDEGLFECLLDESNLLAVLLDRGTVPEAFSAADGEGRVTVTLPRDADVRLLAGELRSRYAESELLARRERSASGHASRGFETRFDERLTDRQREVLRTAYFSGFFETPRLVTGGDLAGRLGIAQPTFNGHLRAALRKLLDLLYDED
ncbi:PAS domain S-box protein [Halegenticoccus tardaugens]|uniref:PAS domain S-box protein n=1 Tax=Halegenticoccus tardaugens TaxID=2071624 RepID=UPI00100BD7B1|nr:PAS domain S-box protein [Halegenticoccus tardaugens]